MKYRLAFVFFLPLIYASTWALMAQTGATLRGRVADELGAVIPGATITLIAPDGTQRQVTSSAQGEFLIPNLKSGTYTLQAEFNGFQPWLREQLQLPVSEPLLITLVVELVTIETEVNADESGVSVEPDQNLTMTVLEGEFLETLPDNEEDLQEYLQALAGPAAGGARGGQGGAQIYVDGFSGGRLPPREAIMQIRINQNPFSAEYSEPGIGRIEIITRPGNEQWRGSARVGFRNAALDARNAFALTKPELDQQRYSFNFSGPLIKKKMSFFVNVERTGLDASSVVRAQTLAGAFTANVPSANKRKSVFLRTGYLLSKNNTLNAGYSYRSSQITNREFGARFGRGGGGGIFTLPERGSDSGNSNHMLSLSETWLINARLIHETRFRYQRADSDSQARTDGVAINVLDAFNGGGSTCCPNQTHGQEVNFQDYLTWTWKKHTIRGGFQLEYEKSRDLSGSNFNGTYTFSSLDQYRSVLAGERVDPNDPNSALIRPTQFTINRGDPLLAFDQYEASWFVQDDIRVNQNFTLSVGLRHEFQANLADRINFAPRVGIAWAPFRDRKTVIRGGGGLFYDRLGASLYQNTLRFDGVTQQNLVIRNPLYCNPLCPELFTSNSVEVRNTITRILDPHLKAPYSINFNGSVERQLPAGLTTTMTYIFTRGLHQFRTRNINAPLPGTGARPDPALGNIYQYEASARSQFHGLLFRMDRRFGSSFTVFTNYTLSWTNSDADSAQALPADSYNLAPEWGRAFTDRRHSLFIGGNVNLPYGFRLTPTINVNSGTPFNITTGRDDNLDTVINDRPAGIRRNADLSASLYSLLENRCLANCQDAAPLLLQDYLREQYPNGVRAIGPGAVNRPLAKVRVVL